MSSEYDTDHGKREQSKHSGQRLIEIEHDGTIRGKIPPEIREKFADYERFSAVYNGGQIILHGVK